MSRAGRAAPRYPSRMSALPCATRADDQALRTHQPWSPASPIKKLADPNQGQPCRGPISRRVLGVFVIKGQTQGHGFSGRQKSNGMIGLLFALVAKTEHNPDPSILPTDAQYQTAAMEAIAELLK